MLSICFFRKSCFPDCRESSENHLSSIPVPKKFGEKTLAEIPLCMSSLCFYLQKLVNNRVVYHCEKLLVYITCRCSLALLGHPTSYAECPAGLQKLENRAFFQKKEDWESWKSIWFLIVGGWKSSNFFQEQIN